jgi:cation transport ATPase
MSEQQQVTEEQFVLGQRMESLARQNAQQALRIADLEAQIALIQAKAQQPQEETKPVEEVSDDDYEEVSVDTLN